MSSVVTNGLNNSGGTNTTNEKSNASQSSETDEGEIKQSKSMEGACKSPRRVPSRSRSRRRHLTRRRRVGVDERSGFKPNTQDIFKTRLCDFYPKCPDGDNCNFAHGPEELRRNFNNKFKTAMCNRLPQCRSGEYCNYAHDESELRTQNFESGSFRNRKSYDRRRSRSYSKQRKSHYSRRDRSSSRRRRRRRSSSRSGKRPSPRQKTPPREKVDRYEPAMAGKSRAARERRHSPRQKSAEKEKRRSQSFGNTSDSSVGELAGKEAVAKENGQSAKANSVKSAELFSKLLPPSSPKKEAGGEKEALVKKALKFKLSSEKRKWSMRNEGKKGEVDGETKHSNGAEEVKSVEVGQSGRQPKKVKDRELDGESLDDISEMDLDGESFGLQIEKLTSKNRLLEHKAKTLSARLETKDLEINALNAQLSKLAKELSLSENEALRHKRQSINRLADSRLHLERLKGLHEQYSSDITAQCDFIQKALQN